jgi:hypothetical protein
VQRHRVHDDEVIEAFTSGRPDGALDVDVLSYYMRSRTHLALGRVVGHNGARTPSAELWDTIGLFFVRG